MLWHGGYLESKHLKTKLSLKSQIVEALTGCDVNEAFPPVGDRPASVLVDGAVILSLPASSLDGTRCVGRLQNERSAQIIRRLQDEADLSLQYYCHCRYVGPSRTSRPSKRAKLAIICELFVVVYGKAYMFDAIGAFLNSCNLYLQHPGNCDRDVEYRNPHLLSRNEKVVMTSSLRSTERYFDCLETPSDTFDQFVTTKILHEAETPRALVTKLHRSELSRCHCVIRLSNIYAVIRSKP